MEGLDGEGHLGQHLVQEQAGGVSRRSAGRLADGQLGEGVVGGEVLDGAAGPG